MTEKPFAGPVEKLASSLHRLSYLVENASHVDSNTLGNGLSDVFMKLKCTNETVLLLSHTVTSILKARYYSILTGKTS